MKFSKNVNNKEHAPKLIFFNEKKIEKDSDNFWHRKLTLKVRNWLFSIAWFRAGVDLTKYFFYEKVLFFTQLSSHLMRKLFKKSSMLSIAHQPISKLRFTNFHKLFDHYWIIDWSWTRGCQLSNKKKSCSPGPSTNFEITNYDVS